MNELINLANKLSYAHIASCEQWKEGKISRVWREGENICIEYESGNWWHYDEKGEWW